MKNILALGLLCISISAFGGSRENRNDRFYCEGLDPAVDRTACMKEQRAARAEDQRGGLDTPQVNATIRCEELPTEKDYRSCVKRIREGYTTGSVLGGGTITEHRELVPGK
jgi:hypothetical protein